jgi:uncharacterized Zn finger protein (UPF0148 family)
MSNAICKCGKKFFRYSTLQVDCPNCAYAKATQKAQDKRSSDKTSKSTAPWNRGRKSPKIDSGVKRKKSDKVSAKELAWKWVGRYVRLTLTTDGWGRCYTCGAPHDIMHLEAGHFISRAVATTRYHLDNLRNQCKTCNGYQQGNAHIFRRNLVDEIGIERVEALEKLATQTGDDSTAHHLEVAKEYRLKVNALQKQMGTSYWKSKPKKK